MRSINNDVAGNTQKTLLTKPKMNNDHTTPALAENNQIHGLRSHNVSTAGKKAALEGTLSREVVGFLLFVSSRMRPDINETVRIVARRVADARPID